MEISKRTLRFLVVICFLLLLNQFYWLYQAFPLIPDHAASIGLIGGMDRATLIFLTGKLLPQILFLLLEVFLYLYVLIKSIKALRKRA